MYEVLRNRKMGKDQFQGHWQLAILLIKAGTADAIGCTQQVIIVPVSISIGQKTHLLDLLAQLPPSTSEQIAGVAGLHERYVREWLAAMVTGRIIESDAASGTYRLPAEHASWLTRAAGPDNLAFQTQYLVLLASVQDEVVACFSKGGGVPYSSFPHFQRLMAEESAHVVDASLLQVSLPLIPGLVERLQRGIDVADIGCGCGHAINVMAQAFPKSRFVGYDISQEGIAAAQAEARWLGVTNTRFEVQEVSGLDTPGRLAARVVSRKELMWQEGLEP